MTMPDGKIGLALSGGGFRATFFHLGVIRCLRDYGLLEHVAMITSVSGGSIIAAHLVREWVRFNSGPSQFDDAAKKLLMLTESDFRNTETRRFVWRFLFPSWLGTASNGAEAAYDRYLFDNANLPELANHADKGAPKLFILTTDLNNPECAVSFSNDGMRIHGKGREPQSFIETTHPRLATVVAASAAFPPMFVPLKIDSAFTGTAENSLPDELCLTDGGVSDNSGAVVLRKLAAERRDISTLLVSDASRFLDKNRKIDYSKKRVRTLLRVLDILQTRIADEVSEHSSSAFATESCKEIWVRITDKPDAALCSPELAHEIASIRTDLDNFTNAEISSLYSLGYINAENRVQSIGTRPSNDEKFQPFRNRLVSSVPERLSASREVRFKWLSFDIATVVNLAALLIATLVAGFLTWCIYDSAALYCLRFYDDDSSMGTVLRDDSVFDLRPLSPGPETDEGGKLGLAVQTNTLTIHKRRDGLKIVRVRMASSVSISARCITHRHTVVDISEPPASGENTFKQKLDIVVDVSDQKVGDIFNVVVSGVNVGGYSGVEGDFASSRSSQGDTEQKRMTVLLPDDLEVWAPDGEPVKEMFVREAQEGEPKQEYRDYKGPNATVSLDGKVITWEIPSEQIRPFHAYGLKWRWRKIGKAD
ncbi:MAG: patatin-like phospholipase family protein [Rubripirellula sp.]